MDGVVGDGDEEEAHCLHHRSHNMKGPLDAYLRCIDRERDPVRVFSDLSGQYMAHDDRLALRNDVTRRAKILGADATRTGHRVRLPVNDFLAWKRLGLATGCDRFWVTKIIALRAHGCRVEPEATRAHWAAADTRGRRQRCKMFTIRARVTDDAANV